MCASSPGETLFLLQGLSQGIRTDGRKRLQWRPFDVVRGVIGRANGSAHVTLKGDTEVVVGIYGEVQSARTGSMCIHVDCTPAAAWAYNPTRQRTAKETFTTALSMQLSNLYLAKRTGRNRSETLMATMEDAEAGGDEEVLTCPGHPALHCPLDYSALVISAEMAWNLNVDVMVVGCTGGNVIGATTIAIKAALLDLKLPQVEVGPQGEVSLRTENMSPLPQAANAPLATLFLCAGSHFLVDPSHEEESVPHSAVVLGVRPNGEVCLAEICSISTRVTAPGAILPRDLLTLIEDGAPLVVAINAAVMGI